MALDMPGWGGTTMYDNESEMGLHLAVVASMSSNMYTEYC